MSDNSRPTVICLLGPTGIGKTELSLQLAASVDCEIISVDSVMIYRGMNIGSAKPSRAQRNSIPHHLIDILNPDQYWSVADFCCRAQQSIEGICARGKLPLLAGGSMLYFKCLFDGLAKLPESVPEIRTELEQEAAQQGLESLYRELQRIDPDSAAGIHPTQRQRLIRALEIYRLSGEAPSRLKRHKEPGIYQKGYNIKAFALLPENRENHRTRLAARLRKMFDSGLMEEVESLYAKGYGEAQLPSARAVVYKQIYRYLNGEFKRAELFDKCLSANNRLVRHQLTWLRQWSTPLTAMEYSAKTINTSVDRILSGNGGF